MKSRGVCTALCFWGLLALQPVAQAGVGRQCSQSEVTDDVALNQGYRFCSEFVRGTLGGTSTSGLDLDVLNETFGFAWQRLGLSTDTAPSPFGPFQSSPRGLESGTLQFDTPRRDFFAIGLEANAEFLFYFFDYSTLPGTQSIAFDTLGLTDFPGPPLDVAGLFVPAGSTPDPNPPAGVSEPGILMLALTGFGALATRRRRTDKV